METGNKTFHKNTMSTIRLHRGTETFYWDSATLRKLTADESIELEKSMQFTPEQLFPNLKDMFFEYLLQLKLFRIHIWETLDGLYAVLADNMADVPKSAFTQLSQEPEQLVEVRLAKADLLNEAITNGFFNRLLIS